MIVFGHDIKYMSVDEVGLKSGYKGAGRQKTDHSCAFGQPVCEYQSQSPHTACAANRVEKANVQYVHLLHYLKRILVTELGGLRRLYTAPLQGQINSCVHVSNASSYMK